MSQDSDSHRATIAIYDRPPSWRTRKFWRIALPLLAGVGSIALWYAVFS